MGRKSANQGRRKSSAEPTERLRSVYTAAARSRARAPQLHARVNGGLLSAARARRLRERMAAVIALAPYELVHCPADIIDIAENQIDVSGKTGYRRTLDRLHLATMQALGVQRLLTNDETQAAAARALGLDVVLPR